MTDAARKAWLDRVNARIEAQEARVREALAAACWPGEVIAPPLSSPARWQPVQLTFPFAER